MGNIKINKRDFTTALLGQANRDAKRYLRIADFLNSALKVGVQLLVLPEGSLPVHWIPEVDRWCAKNQIALITGVEHVELASVRARCDFKSLADLAIVVEWNKDITYFGSIIESICRDLHCFCIQANSSDYGDSRVMRPTRREVRDIIKAKGGGNCSILADYINIEDLRNFQRKGYELQKEDGTFKPTPPDCVFYFNQSFWLRLWIFNLAMFR